MTAKQPERRVRIGAGAGYSGDRIEPAVELAEHGQLDYLVFECLAQRTIPIAPQARPTDPAPGHHPPPDARLTPRSPVPAPTAPPTAPHTGPAHPPAT
ncbi:acyclic terpene utilization AtuA family protein, partial [Burkholderia contaminans]